MIKFGIVYVLVVALLVWAPCAQASGNSVMSCGSFSLCPEGCYHHWPRVNEECVEVGYGYASPRNNNVRYECSPGSYSNVTTAGACLGCPQGTFQALSGKWWCVPCNDTYWHEDVREWYCDTTKKALTEHPSESSSNEPSQPMKSPSATLSEIATPSPSDVLSTESKQISGKIPPKWWAPSSSTSRSPSDAPSTEPKISGKLPPKWGAPSSNSHSPSDAPSTEPNISGKIPPKWQAPSSSSDSTSSPFPTITMEASGSLASYPPPSPPRSVSSELLPALIFSAFLGIALILLCVGKLRNIAKGDEEAVHDYASEDDGKPDIRSEVASLSLEDQSGESDTEPNTLHDEEARFSDQENGELVHFDSWYCTDPIQFLPKYPTKKSYSEALAGGSTDATGE